MLTGSGKDFVALSSHLGVKAAPLVEDKRIAFSWYKSLTLPLNVGGQVEYSFQLNRIVSYQARLLLQRKPSSCWGVGLIVGRDEAGNNHFDVSFAIDFGAPTNLIPT